MIDMLSFTGQKSFADSAQLPPIYLRGLDPDTHYEIQVINGIRSGLGWMHAGLSIERQDFESTVRRIRRVLVGINHQAF